MKTTIATILLAFFFATFYGQTENPKFLLDSAKALFKSEKNLDQAELDNFDYNQIATILEKVIEMEPANAEARYFLGYTYGRMNSRDGRSIINMNLNLVKKASEQLEKVISLSPRYEGETMFLDPYSKITAEWGSLAMCYRYKNYSDSAVWAFREGEKRGGFDNFILDLDKKVLDACSPNAILISSGDNFTLPLWYLQMTENYRNDVTVIDISLLNTTWYPKYLSQTENINFGLPAAVIDTIEYMPWSDSVVTINNFSWTVKPSLYNQYILRGDRLFLSLLKENKFKRDVYFTTGFYEDSRLSLGNYLTNYVFVDKLTVTGKADLPLPDYKKIITEALKLLGNINLNSDDEIRMFENFRYNMLGEIHNYLENNQKDKAKELFLLLEQSANEKKLPYSNEDVIKYVEYLRQNLLTDDK